MCVLACSTKFAIVLVEVTSAGHHLILFKNGLTAVFCLHLVSRDLTRLCFLASVSAARSCFLRCTIIRPFRLPINNTQFQSIAEGDLLVLRLDVVELHLCF